MTKPLGESGLSKYRNEFCPQIERGRCLPHDHYQYYPLALPVMADARPDRVGPISPCRETYQCITGRQELPLARTAVQPDS